MLRTQFPLSLALSILLTISCTLSSYAQSSDSGLVSATAYGSITNINQTPSPGSGHSYLHDLNETVNPANGAVSIRIEASRPHERSFNFPLYAFMYDSDAEQTVQMWQNNDTCITGNGTQITGQYGPPVCVFSVQHPKLYDTNYLNALNGGYESINLGPNTLVYQRQLTFVSVLGDTVVANCQLNTGYVYEDPYGVKHNLGLVNIMAAHSTVGGSAAGICNQYFEIRPIPVGGDAQYKAYTSGESPVYNPQFASPFAAVVVGNDGANVWANIDANGNNANGTGRTGSYGPYGTYGNPNAATPGASGLPFASGTFSTQYAGYSNPYIYTVANQPMTYQIGYTDVTPVGETLCGGTVGGNSNNHATYTTSDGSTALYPKFTSMTLPNGLSYTFGYDSAYGLLNQITYPTGAWVSYTWDTNINSEAISWENAPGGISSMNNVDPLIGTGGTSYTNGGAYYNTSYCNFRHDFPVIKKRIVSYDGVHNAQEQDFAYTTTWPSDTATDWSAKTTTVTTTDLVRPGHPSFKTVYTYLPAVTFPSFLGRIVTSSVPQESTIDYYDFSGALLKTVQKLWSGPYSFAQLTAECTLLPSGAMSGSFYQYATYPNYYGTYGTDQTNIITDVQTYDYGVLTSSCTRPTSVPTRETVTTLANLGASVNFPSSYSESGGASVPLPGFWNKPASIKSYENGTLIAETDYGYDESATVPVSNPIGHVDVPSTFAKGNLTTITKRCVVTTSACVDSITKITYDSTGLPVTILDSLGNSTALSYADNYTTDDGSPGGNTNTYLTQITKPTTSNGVAHIVSFQYDFIKGVLRNSTDENGKVSSFVYGDPWNRLTQSKSPDGGQTTLVYSDGGPNPTVQKTSLVDTSGTSLTSLTVMDGFGHVIQKQLTSDPLGTGYVDTTYDGEGQPYTVSNPYRSRTEPTYGMSTNTYDALGRSTMITHPDGSSASNLYQSNITTTTDENGSSWVRTSDALGDFIKVTEPLGAITYYQYSMGNLICAAQDGSSGGSFKSCPAPPSSWHPRTFSYDGLGKLLSSYNPETGGTTYSYDANGNLITKTDARGFTTNYSYDALGRMIQMRVPIVNASGVVSLQYQSTCYQYDTMSGAPASANLIGHLVAKWTQNGSSCGLSYTPSGAILTAKAILSYDAMGRPLLSQQCVKTMCTTSPFTQSQTYDLAGSLTSWTDGRNYMTFTEQFDAAGRPASLTNSISGNGLPSVLFSAQGYNAAGALQNWNVGGYLNFFRSYDTRLRVSSESVSH